MLRGGGNGGAKPFILNLVRELAKQQPKVMFHNICKPELVEELKYLQAPNLIFTPLVPAVTAGRWLSSRRLAQARSRLQRWLAARYLTLGIKSQPDLRKEQQLLFCPFGAPLLHHADLTTVSTFYDLQVLAYPDFFPTAAQTERLGHFHQMLTKASRIAAISNFSRQEAIQHGADPGSIRAIPIRMGRSPKTTLIGQPPFHLVSGRFFLYPANLWRHKNHELLLNAFAMARNQALPGELMLVCTGDGVDRLEPLRKLGEQLGLAKAVMLTGFVSAAELEGLYQHALGMVFPSLYEGFGMPIIEAMARGLPVACSETTALKEVAGEAALLFHPGNPQQIANAMLQLANDPALREQLIERGLRQAESYSQPAVMAQQYWELFQEAHAAKPAAQR